MACLVFIKPLTRALPQAGAPGPGLAAEQELGGPAGVPASTPCSPLETLREKESPESHDLLHPRERHHPSDGLREQRTWDTEDLEGQKTRKTRGLEAQRTLGHKKPKERPLTRVPQYPWRKRISRHKDDMAKLRHGCKVGEQPSLT